MQQAPRRAILAASAVLALALAGCTSSTSTHAVAGHPGVPAPSSDTGSAASLPSPTPTHRSTTHAAPSPQHRKPTPVHTTSSPSHAPAVALASALPLRFRTGGATQVITVTAASTASTQGTLQPWRKVAGGWRRVGAAVHAWLGSDGITTHPSETRSATPIGSFTLTRAFGSNTDPGTALPYRRTTPADWWISQAGPLYNTLQHCASHCAFTQGDPNEHLYYTQPYYRYAVVIDYNTRNSPTGVVQGAGSAFFLHVTVDAPTAGCVSIDQPDLVRIMRWLSPARQPRILIGIGH